MVQPSGRGISPPDMLVSAQESDTYTAARARKVLLDRGKYDEAQRWLEQNWGSLDTPPGVELKDTFPFPEPGQIRANLGRLASTLEEFLGRLTYSRVEISSGFRPPAHNNVIGGVSTSRHMGGLAADVSVFDDEGREMSPRHIAYKARGLDVSIEKAIVYDTFVHLAIPRSEGAYNGTEIISADEGGDDQSSAPIASGGRVETASRFEGEIPDVREQTQASRETLKGEAGNLILEQLGVKQKEFRGEGKESYEQADLAEKGPPVEGEIDIGDLRFGSVMFDEADPSDLNQTSAINQQNAGSVGMPQMLRTDMNPVISDNTALPETVVTLSINATERDDVNRRLRPLIAMHRRMPFCLARNADLARMMLGVGVTGSTADRLERLYTEMSEAERRRVAENVNERSPSSIWVPVTLRDISVKSQPGSGNLYRTHVVMRYVNASTYVPEKRQFTTPIRALNTPQSPSASAARTQACARQWARLATATWAQCASLSLRRSNVSLSSERCSLVDRRLGSQSSTTSKASTTRTGCTRPSTTNLQ